MEKLRDSRLVAAACARLSTSSNVVESRMAAVASRTSFIRIRIPHVFSSMHSSHLRYAVLGAGQRSQGSFEHTQHVSNRCVIRRFAEEIAAALPLSAQQHTMILSSSRISSRNRCGIFSRTAISEISTGPLRNSWLRTSSALRAYLDFCESIFSSIKPIV
jgi:hypothetical protein